MVGCVLWNPFQDGIWFQYDFMFCMAYVEYIWAPFTDMNPGMDE